jgi:hypothetical protein
MHNRIGYCDDFKVELGSLYKSFYRQITQHPNRRTGGNVGVIDGEEAIGSREGKDPLLIEFSKLSEVGCWVTKLRMVYLLIVILSRLGTWPAEQAIPPEFFSGMFVGQNLLILFPSVFHIPKLINSEKKQSMLDTFFVIL